MLTPFVFNTWDNIISPQHFISVYRNKRGFPCSTTKKSKLSYPVAWQSSLTLLGLYLWGFSSWYILTGSKVTLLSAKHPPPPPHYSPAASLHSPLSSTGLGNPSRSFTLDIPVKYCKLIPSAPPPSPLWPVVISCHTPPLSSVSLAMTTPCSMSILSCVPQLTLTRWPFFSASECFKVRRDLRWIWPTSGSNSYEQGYPESYLNHCILLYCIVLYY